MEVKLKITDYNEADGIHYNWEEGFEIDVKSSNSEIIIKANKAGLVSLALQLLTLAQDSVPVDNHLHYDKYNSLEMDSRDLVIQKTA